MVKKFTIPFASQGDANDIPDALQVDGKVSFTQGFGYDYERPYDDPQAKDIAREDMNGLFKAITSAVGELQTLGASEWSIAISYPKGAIVYFEKDLYISQVDDNQNTPPQNWVSITSIANDSLKKVANLSDLTNKATARNNLGLGNSATLNKTDVPGTSTSLVATQKLVNDTKINLDNSKQDKLTFVGDGLEVMKVGAYGLGSKHPSYTNIADALIFECRFVAANGVGTSDIWKYGRGINISANAGTAFTRIVSVDKHIGVVNYENGKYVWIEKIYHNLNTTVDRSGFLRAAGSANAITDNDKTSEMGDSVNLVATQLLVKKATDVNLARKDVTEDRAIGSSYVNGTKKTMYAFIQASNTSFNEATTVEICVGGESHKSTVVGAGASASLLLPILPGEGYSYAVGGSFDSYFIEEISE